MESELFTFIFNDFNVKTLKMNDHTTVHFNNIPIMIHRVCVYEAHQKYLIYDPVMEDIFPQKTFIIELFSQIELPLLGTDKQKLDSYTTENMTIHAKPISYMIHDYMCDYNLSMCVPGIYAHFHMKYLVYVMHNK